MLVRKTALALLLGLASGAGAAESDGDYAPPERWTHPRGPASASGRSRARAPWSFGGLRWTFHAKKAILAPPVTWDGVAFVLDGSKRETALVAVDTRNGKLVARTTVKQAVLPQPAAFDRSLFVAVDGNRIAQYRLQGRKLARRWSFEVGEDVSAPRVLQGEIYVTTSGGLLRLRAGSRKPVWKAMGRFTGAPAVFGDHVYALARTDKGELEAIAFNRSDGQRVTSCVVAPKAPSARGGRIAVTAGLVAALLPPEKDDRWAILSRKVEKGVLTLAAGRTETLVLDPLVGTRVLTLTDKRAWTVFSLEGKRPVNPFVSEKDRPELVQGATAPIATDNAICFGTWALEHRSNRILWHLNEHDKPLTFQHGVRYNAVPADHELLLVVAKNGKALYAIGSEEIGK